MIHQGSFCELLNKENTLLGKKENMEFQLNNTQQ